MVAERSDKEEDRLGAGQLSREADRIKWHFLLIQDDERDQHAGLTMAPLVTKTAYNCVEIDKAELSSS